MFNQKKTMGIKFLIIIVVFNLLWMSYGFKMYLNGYNFKEDKIIATIMWLFLLFGIVNLIYLIS
jgi:hypothetical protein